MLQICWLGKFQYSVASGAFNSTVLTLLTPESDTKKHADSISVFSHGGLKTLHSVGMKEFDGKKFAKSLEYWEQIQRSGATCAIMMYWFSTEAMQKSPQSSSAWSHRDIGVWW
jgi:hypothetical protein